MTAYDLAAIISEQFDIDDQAARDLAMAAGDLWYELSLLGWVDAPYGAEALRVLPQALALIRRETNQPPPARLELVPPSNSLSVKSDQEKHDASSTTIPRPAGPRR